MSGKPPRHQTPDGCPIPNALDMKRGTPAHDSADKFSLAVITMIDTINSVLQLLAHITTIGGIPLAIFLFLHERAKDRAIRENETFDSLDEKYTEFMLLGFENPGVLLEILSPKSIKYNSRQIQRQKALLAVLFSLFERVYVMFENQHSDFRRRQWEGWIRFIRSYAVGEVFKREWKLSGNQFDSDFQVFMNELLGIDGQKTATAP